MKSNLHTHSFFSDGSLSPETVAELAHEAGVGIAALSDHNTFAGCERFASACAKHGIHAIKAVEIDCVQPEIGFHSELLAYFPDGGGEQIQPILDRQVEARKNHVIHAMQRAEAYFDIDDRLFNYDYFHQWVVEVTGYDLTCSAGIAPLYLSNKQLHMFITKRWGRQLPNYETSHDMKWWKDIWATCEPTTDTLHNTIKAVRAAGGYAVLPHFAISCKFNPEEMARNSDIYLERLSTMKSLGLWGMEIHPYRYKPTAHAMNEQVRRWAEALGLQLTAGSDFHGYESTHNIYDGMSFEFDGFPVPSAI